MIYQLKKAYHFNGIDDYIDISEKLHEFLAAKTFGMRACFSTESPGYGVILGIYYKESLLPDFSVAFNKGCLTVSTKINKRLCVLSDQAAVNDGEVHELILNGDANGLTAWIDGRMAFHEDEAAPYCDFGYVGFATVGRGILNNQFAAFYSGDILALELSRHPFPTPERKARDIAPSKTVLFERGMAGVENFRIPTLVTTPSGVVIASADARIDAPGDNPNHIARAVRLSRDSGETWEDLVIPVDFGGVGREEGAAAIDGQLVVDDGGEAGIETVFMLYGHTKDGIGSARSLPGTGFDKEGRRLLYGRDKGVFFQQPDGHVITEDGRMTEYRVDARDRLYAGEKEIGSVCHGEKSPLHIAATSFLQLIESHDGGRTWSDPRDLNAQVKKPWMCFLGPGPGNGICMKEGTHKGRLVCPVYFSNPSGVYSCAAIYSDDHGKTWKMGDSVNDGRELNGELLCAKRVNDRQAMTGECQLTELPGGILKIFMRNPCYDHMAAALSADGGASWSEFTVENQLTNPDCQGCILRVKERELYLFSGPDHETLRVRGTVWLSEDDTGSWSKKRLLEPGEFAYSCMTVLPDGNIGILFEGLNISLYFAKFPVSWVIDGEN